MMTREEQTNEMRWFQTHDLDNVTVTVLQQKFVVYHLIIDVWELLREEWRAIPVVDGGLEI